MVDEEDLTPRSEEVTVYPSFTLKERLAMLEQAKRYREMMRGGDLQ